MGLHFNGVIIIRHLRLGAYRYDRETSVAPRCGDIALEWTSQSTLHKMPFHGANCTIKALGCVKRTRLISADRDCTSGSSRNIWIRPHRGSTSGASIVRVSGL